MGHVFIIIVLMPIVSRVIMQYFVEFGCVEFFKMKIDENAQTLPKTHLFPNNQNS